jgi:hypothetical protein
MVLQDKRERKIRMYENLLGKRVQVFFYEEASLCPRVYARGILTQERVEIDERGHRWYWVTVDGKEHPGYHVELDV